MSIFFGDQIARESIAAQLVKPEYLAEIVVRMNQDFQYQLDGMGGSLLFFLGWLVCYTTWWVFGASSSRH